jgi:drug/metabolite transporter (DMT)-like permease
MPAMKPTDLARMLLLAAIWGASFMLLRTATPALGPWVVAGGRVLGGACVIGLWMAWRREALPARSHVPALLLTALLSAVLPFVGFSWASRSLPAGLMAILNATTPMWGALVGWLWAKEPMGWRRVGGLALGFFGVAVLVWPGQAPAGALPMDGTRWLSVAAALGSTLMYALAVHQNHRQLGELAPLPNSLGTLAMASITLAPWVMWDGMSRSQALLAAPAPAWLALAALAVMCTGVAYLLFYELLARIGPSPTLTVTYLIPVFGMLWAHLLLDEAITARMLTSVALVLLGVWWAQHKEKKP